MFLCYFFFAKKKVSIKMDNPNKIYGIAREDEEYFQVMEAGGLFVESDWWCKDKESNRIMSRKKLFNKFKTHFPAWESFQYAKDAYELPGYEGPSNPSNIHKRQFISLVTEKVRAKRKANRKRCRVEPIKSSLPTKNTEASEIQTTPKGDEIKCFILHDEGVDGGRSSIIVPQTLRSLVEDIWGNCDDMNCDEATFTASNDALNTISEIIGINDDEAPMCINACRHEEELKTLLKNEGVHDDTNRNEFFEFWKKVSNICKKPIDTSMFF